MVALFNLYLQTRSVPWWIGAVKRDFLVRVQIRGTGVCRNRFQHSAKGFRPRACHVSNGLASPSRVVLPAALCVPPLILRATTRRRLRSAALLSAASPSTARTGIARPDAAAAASPATDTDALTQIGQFIDDVCRTKRIHSALGYFTLAAFEADWVRQHSEPGEDTLKLI